MLNVSCASFSRKTKSIAKKPIGNNLQLLNGTYYVDTIGDYHVIEVVSRTSKERPWKPNKEGLLTLKLDDNNALRFTYIENGLIIEDKLIKIKKVKKNYVYLRNKNVKIYNIPLILGGFDIQRTRLFIDETDSLVINTADVSFGSALLIIWGRKISMEDHHRYYRKL
jgi:hypothetical protein